MNVSPLKFGCQTYTWEMLGSAWTGGPDDLVRAIAEGGYQGIEITDTMIGSFAGRAAEFARRLDDAGLALVSFAFGSDGGFTERGQISALLHSDDRIRHLVATPEDAEAGAPVSDANCEM